MKSILKDKYKNAIAKKIRVNPGQVSLYWKGRVALYALLNAMGVKEGVEVIMPAFTCIVVPNSVLYLGAKPVYVDIDASTFNMNVSSLKNSITEKTKVILIQNTYGLSSNVRQIVDLAKQYNIYTIEDCTHGFGGEFDGRPNGSFCDAAFYSTQWNKPFSTGVGGFSIINNAEINLKVKNLDKDLVNPTVKEVLSLRLQLFLRRHLLSNSNYWALLRLYRYLSKNNLVTGSSSGDEISDINIPDQFFKSSGKFQAEFGLIGLDGLDAVLEKRKRNAQRYTEFLKKRGKNFVNQELELNHSFLKYPLRVKDRALFFELAEENKITLGDWFTSPLHPVTESLSRWHFDPTLFPNSSEAASEVVNLPTDLSPDETHRVVSFLIENLELIKDL